MRYSISLILLLLCVSGHATITALKVQKWTAQILSAEQIEAAPVITPNGEVAYTSTNRKLYTIPAQAEGPIAREPVHISTPLHWTRASPAVSPDGRHLYVSYIDEGNAKLKPKAVFAIYDTNQAHLNKPVWSHTETNMLFSAPTVDTQGNIYLSAIRDDKFLSERGERKYNGTPRLLKISRNKASYAVTTVKFTDTKDPTAVLRIGKKLGPAVYNNATTGGAAIVVRKDPASYLFYTSFEKIKSYWHFWDYCYYHGWSSELSKHNTYSVPAIDNNPHNHESYGEIYVANSSGKLEAYQQPRGKEQKNTASNPRIPCKWSYPLSNNDLSKSTPVVAKNGTVYIGDSTTGILYVYNHAKKIHWSKKLSAYGITKAPAVDDRNELVYVVDNNGDLFAIDTHDHSNVQSDDENNGTFITAPVVKPNGNVIIGTKAGKIIAYQGGHLYNPALN